MESYYSLCAKEKSPRILLPHRMLTTVESKLLYSIKSEPKSLIVHWFVLQVDSFLIRQTLHY